jgi:hypothetical protein
MSTQTTFGGNVSRWKEGADDAYFEKYLEVEVIDHDDEETEIRLQLKGEEMFLRFKVRDLLTAIAMRSV